MYELPPMPVKKKPRPPYRYQQAVRDDQTQAGGLFYVAHNFTDFRVWFDALAVRTAPQKDSQSIDNQDTYNALAQQ